ncbi:MAG: aspartate kinase [Abditibacteriota bacterium]|nr:aspartate kinase [Abditibacteriota bacterium]
MRVVQKYGGSSVATPEKMAVVAQRVAKRAQDAQVIVVISAMGDTTDDLIAIAKQINPKPDAREMDKLMASGEQISSALLTMALHNLGCDAISFTGAQAGIITENIATKARIKKIDTKRLRQELDKGKVVVVAGFQGITDNNIWADITTLGRGGSDTTAVAIAAALNTPEDPCVCEIFTDVEGVYTCDPRIEPNAKKLDTISYEEMLEMATYGARVMHNRAVELGWVYDVEILVAHSQKECPGTVIKKETDNMELRNPVKGIAHDTDVAKITLAAVPDQPGIAAKLFKSLTDGKISVDIIVQNIAENGKTDISFSVSEDDCDKAAEISEAIKQEMGAARVIVTKNVAKISIVGSGMESQPGYASTMFSALAERGINILAITTSEIRITCLIEEDRVKEAVRILHKAFELDA